MRQEGTETHLGSEKFTCEICNDDFTDRLSLKQHLYGHAEQKSDASCFYCKKKFRSRKHLDRHLRTHTGEKPYSCEVCQREYSDESSFKKHCLICKSRWRRSSFQGKEENVDSFDEENIKSESQLEWPSQHECDICMKKFSNEMEMEEHFCMQSDQSSNEISEVSNITEGNKEEPVPVPNCRPQLSCDFCGMWFRDVLNWQDHEKRHINGNTFHCNTCERYFDERQMFQLHMLTHSSKRRQSFDSTNLQPLLDATSDQPENGSKQESTASSTGEKQNSTLECAICSKCFKTRIHLLIHLEKHKDETDLQCQVCDNAFLDLQKHLLFHIKGQSAEYAEEENGVNITESNSQLAASSASNLPLKAESKKRQINCAKCGKLLLPKSLKRHMLMHSKSAKYAKEKAGLSEPKERSHFAGSSTSHPPLQVESNKKLKKCVTCGKLLSSRSLRRHMQIHLTKKPYSCNICQKKFSDSSNRRKHQRKCLSILNSLDREGRLELHVSNHIENVNSEVSFKQ